MMSQLKLTVFGVVLTAFLSSFVAPSHAADEPDCRAAAAPGINWENCDRKLLMLKASDLSGANLFDTNLTSTDLRDSNLVEANFEKATLFRASLAGSKAAGTRFDRVEAYRADFSEIDAVGASFGNAEMQRVRFHNAKLANTDFTKADLGRAQFDGADITGSRFALANLARADFRETTFDAALDFDRAFVFLARFEGVDLSDATGLTQSQLDIACGDDSTGLPAGLTRPSGWPCNFEQE